MSMKIRSLSPLAMVLWLGAGLNASAQPNLIVQSTFGDGGTEGARGTQNYGVSWTGNSANNFCPWYPFRRAGANYTYRAVNRCTGFPTNLNPYSYDQMDGSGGWNLNSVSNLRYGLLSMTNPSASPAQATGGVYNRLAVPTLPGTTYTIDFWYNVRSFSGPTMVDSVRFELSNSLVDIAPYNQPESQVGQAVNLGISGAAAGAGLVSQSPICGTKPPNVTWHHVNISFVANGAYPFAGLAFYFSNTSGVFVYLDDIRLLGPGGTNCPLDVNFDGVYNGADVQLLCSLNGTAIGCANMQLQPVDVDANGTINYHDIAQFISNTCGACQAVAPGMALEPGQVSSEQEVIHSSTWLTTDDIDPIVVPNPSHGELTLYTTNIPANTPVQVIAADGRLVSNARTNDNARLELDLTQEPVGLYTVRILCADRERTLRIMKE